MKKKTFLYFPLPIPAAFADKKCGPLLTALCPLPLSTNDLRHPSRCHGRRETTIVFDQILPSFSRFTIIVHHYRKIVFVFVKVEKIQKKIDLYPSTTLRATSTRMQRAAGGLLPPRPPALQTRLWPRPDDQLWLAEAATAADLA